MPQHRILHCIVEKTNVLTQDTIDVGLCQEQFGDGGASG